MAGPGLLGVPRLTDTRWFANKLERKMIVKCITSFTSSSVKVALPSTCVFLPLAFASVRTGVKVWAKADGLQSTIETAMMAILTTSFFTGYLLTEERDPTSSF